MVFRDDEVESKNKMDMRKILTLGASLLFLSAAVTNAEPDSDVSEPDAKASSMKGTYVGDFGGSKITVCIDRIIGKTITGYSIVAGNERAFSGSFEDHEQGYAIVAAEPGDDPADGVFKMIYATKTDDLGGVWKANNSKKIAERVFVLPRRVFKYNARSGQYPQSSTKDLKEADVENLRPADLRIMRNEIYARHGYGFKLADMRAHFEKQDWYMAISQDITGSLTAREKKNAALIKRYENYGAEYYDSFGR
ncbi:MAG: hypothetical protein RLZZ505_1844 [Verrucomicrobiota bacterium]|jgi:hypothetical protein